MGTLKGSHRAALFASAIALGAATALTGVTPAARARAAARRRRRCAPRNSAARRPPCRRPAGSAATPGQTATGALNAVTVSDLRGTGAGWDLVGQVTEFTSTGGGVIPAANLGWTPAAQVASTSLVANGVTTKVAAGGAIAPGAGLGTSRTLCSAETGSSLGSATCGAALNLGIPESSAAGEYSAVLTLTLA